MADDSYTVAQGFAGSNMAVYDNTISFIQIIVEDAPEAVTELPIWWTNWSEATTPVVSAGLITAGRDIVRAEILKWLQGPPSVIEVAADTRDEALAFVAAIISQLSQDDGDRNQSRCLIVHEPKMWRRLLSSSSPLILIPDYGALETAGAAVKKGHHVYIPLAVSEGGKQSVIMLPPLKREVAERELIGLGTDPGLARDLAGTARRSLSAFRRIRSNFSAQRPKWSAPEHGVHLLGSILAGCWIDGLEGDRIAIETITGQPYPEIVNSLVRWEASPDAPLRKRDDVWSVTARDDAWYQVSALIHADILDRLEEVAVGVLSELDPAYELPKDERMSAALFGKSLTRSRWLRRGVSDTIAMAAGLPVDARSHSSVRGQDLANRVVRRVLRSSSIWTLWASLSSELPLLAEAAPDEYLAALDESLSSHPDEFKTLMSDSEIGMLGSTHQTGLLWGLEAIAWEPSKLGKVSELLARLGEIDPNPNSNHVNRPRNSLCSLFSSWLPQTTASAEQRLRVIDRLRSLYPNEAWLVMLSALPYQGQLGNSNVKPNWRDWSPDDSVPNSPAEVWRFTSEMIHRLVQDARNDGYRWADLISHRLDELPDNLRDVIFKSFESVCLEDVSLTSRLALRAAIREVLSRHRDSIDSPGVLPAKYLETLEIKYKLIHIPDPIDDNAWLFESFPLLPDVSNLDTDEHNRQVLEMRKVGLRAILEHGEIPSILILAERAEAPWTIGVTLSYCDLKLCDELELLNQLTSPISKVKTVARAYVECQAHRAGWAWVVDHWDKMLSNQSTEAQAAFLLSLPCESRTWLLLTNDETRIAYWSSVSLGRLASIDDCLVALGELERVHRPLMAIEVMARNLQDGVLPCDIDQCARLVEQIAIAEPDPELTPTTLAYALGLIVNILADHPEMQRDRMVGIEWLCMPILNHRRWPKLLAQELSMNPSFFLEVLSFVYRGNVEEQSEPTKQSQNRAKYAYILLRDWKWTPGRQESGGFDGDHLRTWIEEVQRGAATSGRSKMADIHIGRILSFAPSGTDGHKPVEAVRNVLEDLQSQAIEDAMITQIINNRGGTWRRFYDGGEQERELARGFEADAEAFKHTWPHTAGLFKSLASIYYHEAEREDTNAQLREDYAD